MRVLILSSWYPNNSNIVNGIFVKEQAKALQSVGAEVLVFYPYDNSVEKGKLAFSLEEDIPTYRANTEYLRNYKISRVNSILRSTMLLRKIVKENNIDIINAHVCQQAGILASFFYKLYKVPYVITEHRSNIREFANKSYNNLLFKNAYGNAKKVITVSSFLKKELVALGYKFNGEVIGNTVNVSQFSINHRIRKENEFRILFIGSMAKNDIKGLQFFIPAAADFVKENSDKKFSITFVGEGIKRSYFQQLVKEVGIGDICNFVGSVDKSYIPEYINNCDFLVLSSIKETFSAVLIEAMASGKPVLATKCGGPEEIVNEKVGILVEPFSSDALKNGLVKMIKSYESFIPEDIRKYSIDNYSYESIGRKIKKVLEEALVD